MQVTEPLSEGLKRAYKELGPQDPLPFPALLNRLSESKTPFRISFLIEGGGVQAEVLWIDLRGCATPDEDRRRPPQTPRDTALDPALRSAVQTG